MTKSRSSSSKNSAWNKQFVWPREGPKGSRPRTFLSSFLDILRNRGPDIFITPLGTPTIKLDQWANWDSYHSPDIAAMERLHSYNGLWDANRGGKGGKRYCPEKRRYESWEWDDNFALNPLFAKPRFTQKEHEKLARKERKVHRKGKVFHPPKPKRLRNEHVDFWTQAHRAGSNLANGMPIETNNLAFDRYYTNFVDRANGIPGAGRRAAARSLRYGVPDTHYGGAVNRRWGMPIRTWRDGGREGFEDDWETYMYPTERDWEEERGVHTY